MTRSVGPNLGARTYWTSSLRTGVYRVASFLAINGFWTSCSIRTNWVRKTECRSWMMKKTRPLTTIKQAVNMSVGDWHFDPGSWMDGRFYSKWVLLKVLSAIQRRPWDRLWGTHVCKTRHNSLARSHWLSARIPKFGTMHEPAHCHHPVIAIQSKAPSPLSDTWYDTRWNHLEEPS